MSGNEFKNEVFSSKQMNDGELWVIFNAIFSKKYGYEYIYKYGFFKSILDNLYNVDEHIMLTYDQIFNKFAEIYWNLVIFHKVNIKIRTSQGRESSLERLLKEFNSNLEASQTDPAHPVNFERLSKENQERIGHIIKQKYKDAVLKTMFRDSGEILYTFSKKTERLQLNPQVYGFMTKHRQVLEKMNYYEWAVYLEKANQNQIKNDLLYNLNTLNKRSDLMEYQKFLLQENRENLCFYCGSQLLRGKIRVDHVIPWSYIKEDYLWNMVLSCPDCGNKKHEKMVPESYLEKLIHRNTKLMEASGREAGNQEAGDLNMKPDLQIKNYKPEKLRYIYFWAKCNGFNQIWVPEQRF